MTQPYVTLHVSEGIGWVQFNRADKLNALNPDVLNDLSAILSVCEKDNDIRVVVLKGHDRAFIAGADIQYMAEGDVSLAYRLAGRTGEVQDRLADMDKPTIAAISGYALGGGCEMALCCDFRIGADNSIMGLPEIKLGIIPGGGGTQRLPRLIGIGPAMRLVLTGDMIKADDAVALGLLDKKVALSSLTSEVKTFARTLAGQPKIALRAAKQALLTGMNMSLRDGLKLEQQAFSMLFGTCDQKEGMAAFIENRTPDFQGQ